jgi:hypothetical protein
MRDGIVPLLSEGIGGMDCRVRVGTDALKLEDCLRGMVCCSVGDSYVEVEPDRVERGGGFCHDTAESWESLREWLEIGDRRDELDPRDGIGCRDEVEVEVDSPDVTEECELCRLLTGRANESPISGDLIEDGSLSLLLENSCEVFFANPLPRLFFFSSRGGTSVICESNSGRDNIGGVKASSLSLRVGIVTGPPPSNVQSSSISPGLE